MFYEALGVPDTLDGRFDLMVLHGFLVFRALRGKGKEAGQLAQDTTDLMFSAFDDAIRAIGVGDGGVPRRVKTMAKAYIGRSGAYEAALDANDPAALQAALTRNIYRDEPALPGAASALTRYVTAEALRLKALPVDAFFAGELNFPQPDAPSAQ